MVDTLYFSGRITETGEVLFDRIEKHNEVVVPRRVDLTSVVPKTLTDLPEEADPMNNDPTLVQFHDRENK